VEKIMRALALLFVGAASVQAAENFAMHAYHAAKLGRLECNLCHVSATKGSLELKRPGHEQCKLCHTAVFESSRESLICRQCHASAAPRSGTDVVNFPVHPPSEVLSRFSHKLHVDAKGRIDSSTGFRADCAFCHKVNQAHQDVSLPSHTQCGACHSKPGMKPELTTFLRTAGCRGCHAPEDTERAAADIAPNYPSIRFSHTSHFRIKQEFGLDCLTCHYSIAKSTRIAELALPRMIDCASCHASSKRVPVAFRIANCAGCHLDAKATGVLPAAFNPNTKPAFHTEAFRVHHEEAAASSDAKCFACHQNVVASGRDQCISCHLVMRPISHTARWKDDIHGKYAALDRQTCATCHTADYCSRCHNEMPNSHVPLAVFKNGGHANLAILNERACLTCHTFQNTCSTCHIKTPLKGLLKH
jgi:hypothetical protein